MVSHCACPTRAFRGCVLQEDNHQCSLQARLFFLQRVGWLILDCARRTSTFLSCAFREQEDDQATLPILLFPQVLNPMRRDLGVGSAINSRMASNTT